MIPDVIVISFYALVLTYMLYVNIKKTLNVIAQDKVAAEKKKEAEKKEAEKSNAMDKQKN